MDIILNAAILRKTNFTKYPLLDARENVLIGFEWMNEWEKKLIPKKSILCSTLDRIQNDLHYDFT